MSNLWVIPEELGDYADSEYAYEACKMASYLMWALSGRKFSGLNTVTEHYAPLTRTVDNTEFFIQSQVPWAVNSALPFSDTVPIDDLHMRGLPVQSITSISYADGTVVGPDRYVLLDKRWIHFKDNVTRPVNITYTFGVAPPTAGRMAARYLAEQFAKQWAGDAECELPDRVTSVTRQGVSFTVLDNQEFIQDLRTGVYSVDLFLKSVNPDTARARSKVFSPDIQRGRRVNAPRQVTSSGWSIVNRGGQ